MLFLPAGTFRVFIRRIPPAPDHHPSPPSFFYRLGASTIRAGRTCHFLSFIGHADKIHTSQHTNPYEAVKEYRETLSEEWTDTYTVTVLCKLLAHGRETKSTRMYTAVVLNRNTTREGAIQQYTTRFARGVFAVSRPLSWYSSFVTANGPATVVLVRYTVLVLFIGPPPGNSRKRSSRRSSQMLRFVF